MNSNLFFAFEMAVYVGVLCWLCYSIGHSRGRLYVFRLMASNFSRGETFRKQFPRGKVIELTPEQARRANKWH